uniref:Uncharacterized protein n=1 Tax=Zea mays TaxID=4577 RepID=C4IY74_MAIZE|nr:unknown [Zea mays]|eukprot:NP_001170497.1 uncharacterized protein LOC100193092 isoform 2 [Zea mays]
MLNIVYIQMIKAKKVNVMWRSLLLLSPLNRRLAWRKQRILRSMKLMLVALTMMKVTKTLLIQKRVNRMMTRIPVMGMNVRVQMKKMKTLQM